MPIRLSDEERARRFWAKVEKTDSCWIWRGQLGGRGYGHTKRMIDGKIRAKPAHRLAWEMLIGPIPKGLSVLHECDNKLCVRPGPGHMHLGTHQENMREMVERGRQSREFRKPNTKLSDEEARTIFASEESLLALALRYNVSKSLVCMIKKGRCRQRATGAGQ